MYERTPEIRRKISQALKEAHRRRPGAWRKSYVASDEHRELMSKKYKGRKLTPEWIANRTLAQQGLKRSEATRRRLSEAKKGHKSPFWRGGVSATNRSERSLFMSTFAYRNWRRLVFERDSFTCVECGQHGGRLNADHIKPYSKYPDLRLSVENGRTLCVACHRLTETYGGKVIAFV